MADTSLSSLYSNSVYSPLSATTEAMITDEIKDLRCDHEAEVEYRNFLHAFFGTGRGRQQIDNIIVKMKACNQSTKIVEEFIEGIFDSSITHYHSLGISFSLCKEAIYSRL